MKTISMEDWEKLKKQNEFLRVMQVNCFTEPKKMWMQMAVKYRMNCQAKKFNLGTWQVNWDKLLNR